MKEIEKKQIKAIRYANQPARFVMKGSIVTLQSDHGVRTLKKVGNIWFCDCTFYAKTTTCSHVMALESLLGQ
ncbi:MAG: hypothetical protein CO030_04735 [Candidatus Magasanikbacteria bacterium CG_4_9_14_0_2_um_filter_42_11]|uniref:SWIM-type domain-containing protein n=1 Tax=Candidatus Magasanikbacteria bacterium CG_4_9_14_0_2_um_filter_42_11 TaxID=1974643 RepID=A0A2M8F8M8_9BACT|nr:MAG: hypothetical protein COU34_01960 [Candidatus Magasanikbacteria bacterium CG10_big_fil_rev_8_21_14_0_10_43_9]PIY92703.1 MAG: hypothetical protein COY70_01780 [Candidatus Magasanikbacteria bacterium CG_4_10_14_0_8_um_filter_42_12]PJC52082.1 MAG: hypothetical protein CO030_04735 [Candidatus Magasanikbacteria bacterium CG_4_9_14_0_2_um_filter_42_11]